MQDLMESVGYLVTNLFHIYVFYRAYRVFFSESKVPSWVERAAFGIFYVINSFTFLMEQNIYLNLLSSVIPLILITFLYKSSVRIKFFVSILTYVFSMLLDSVVYNMITYMDLDRYLSSIIVTNALASLLYFLFILVMYIVKKQKLNIKISLSHCFAIFFIPMGSMMIVALAAYASYSAGSNMIIVMVLLLINILIFELYNMVENYYQKTYESQLLKQQNEAYLNQFKLIRETEDERRSVRHDLKNHLIALNEYVLQRKWEEVEQYVQKVHKKLIQDGFYVDSGNTAVDAVLNYKLRILKDMKVQVNCEVVIPREIEIEPFDMSLILGNLLHNAIEALEKSEVKNIDILLKVDRGILYIKVSNSYNGVTYKSLVSGKIKYLTSKENRSIHGIGLQNIEKAVNKYNGIMEISSDHQVFCVTIMLYLNA